jgi:hypothetical protein
MLDANLLNNASGTNQNKVLAALSYINSRYLSDPSYLKYNGKPVVADYGLTAASGINWTAIQSTYPNVQFVHLDNATSPDGFDVAQTGGSFLWINPPPSPQNPIPPSMSGVDDFYTRAATHPTEITMGGAYKGFNSAFAPWDAPLHVDQQCGTTWLNTFAKVNQYYNSSKQLPFLQLATWDDYYEGTPLETGIDNCATLGVTVSSTKTQLNINLTHVSTVDHLELYTQGAAGVYNLTGTYAAAMKNIPITGAAGTYYVKAVGKPFIKNVLSPAIVIN